jgi:hypothetical protein
VKNNIKKTMQYREKSLEFLEGPSKIIFNTMPWTFGGCSILNMYWHKTGKLNETLNSVKESLPNLLKIDTWARYRCR